MIHNNFDFYGKKIYYCICCNFFGELEKDLVRHNKTTKHVKNYNKYKKLDKKCIKHECDMCYHSSNNIKDFFIHRYLKCNNRRDKHTIKINKILSKIKDVTRLMEIKNKYGECKTEISSMIFNKKRGKIKMDKKMKGILDIDIEGIDINNITIHGLSERYNTYFLRYMKKKDIDYKLKNGQLNPQKNSILDEKMDKNQKGRFFCECNKEYKSLYSLSRHTKVCSFLKKWIHKRQEYEQKIKTLEEMGVNYKDDFARQIKIITKGYEDKYVLDMKNMENDYIKKIKELSTYKNNLIEHYKTRCDTLENNIFELNENINKLTDTINKKDDKFIEFMTNTNEKLNNTNQLLTNKITDTNEKLTDKMMSMASETKTVNITNNKLSLNMFLKDVCKDAMSLQNFMEKIDVTIEDVQYSIDNGLVNGFNHLFKSLGQLNPIERPIHCTDTKRLKFYVKNKDKWERDENNKKIDKAIKFVEHKQLKNVCEWEKDNPDHLTNPTKYTQWKYMLKNITGDINEKEKNYNKIKKYLSEMTVLNLTDLNINDIQH
mgnify:CR=1 FL=1